MWRRSIWAPLCPLVTRWGQWNRPSISPTQKGELGFSVWDTRCEKTAARKTRHVKKKVEQNRDIHVQLHSELFQLSSIRIVIYSILDDQLIAAGNRWILNLKTIHLHSLDHHQLFHQWLRLTGQIHGPFQHYESVNWREGGADWRVTLHRQHQGDTEERGKQSHGRLIWMEWIQVNNVCRYLGTMSVLTLLPVTSSPLISSSVFG